MDSFKITIEVLYIYIVLNYILKKNSTKIYIETEFKHCTIFF